MRTIIIYLKKDLSTFVKTNVSEYCLLSITEIAKNITNGNFYYVKQLK